mmetsp:Transcript_57311/g.114837  ORF Transcript_57311/g.114837 Transcript_57311/m.114837 type:complete len:209 (+) Transcript_57311:454-1080(+)
MNCASVEENLEPRVGTSFPERGGKHRSQHLGGVPQHESVCTQLRSCGGHGSMAFVCARSSADYGQVSGLLVAQHALPGVDHAFCNVHRRGTIDTGSAVGVQNAHGALQEFALGFPVVHRLHQLEGLHALDDHRKRREVPEGYGSRLGLLYVSCPDLPPLTRAGEALGRFDVGIRSALHGKLEQVKPCLLLRLVVGDKVDQDVILVSRV